MSPGVECRVIRGFTSILLDTSADGVADIAYSVIKQVLEDLSSTDEFLASPLKNAEFVRRIGENLVLQQDEEKSKDSSGEPQAGALAKIASISAVTAFILTALFSVGIIRARQKKEEKSAKMRLAYYNAKRRKFWSQLHEDEDQGTYPGLMMTEPAPMQTVTWSVSDLTSESASIKTSLKMDPIDEEEHEEVSNESYAGDLEEAAFDDLYEEVKEEERDDRDPSPLARPSLSVLPPFIAHWRDDLSEKATQQSESLSDRVWELASMPKSYWDESDPEAPTPDHSPAANHFQSPEGCLYLRDDDYFEDDTEANFADNELDFSSDSPCKQPAMTYTTEEEEYSEASSSTDVSLRRQSDPPESVDGSLTVRRVDSYDNDPLVFSQDSIGYEDLPTPEKSFERNIVKTFCYSKENAGMAKGPLVLDKLPLVNDSKKVVDVDPVVTNSEDIDPDASGDVSTDDNKTEDSQHEDDEEFASVGSSASSTNTNVNGRHKADVFYTPKQQANGKGDSLESVARTIVREAHVYDEATQRWARRILTDMFSPPLKLITNTPHSQ